MGKYFWSRASNWYSWFPNETWIGIFRDVRDCVKYEVFIGSYEEALEEARQFASKHERKLVTLLDYPKAVKIRDKLRGRNRMWEDFLSDAN
jgi:predicted RNase H-like HicB family nuclease